MVPFAGYDMPVQYPLGVMKEHLHYPRGKAGLFDVSHMGQVILSAAQAGPPCCARPLKPLFRRMCWGWKMAASVMGFSPMSAGGIEDDLMFARRGETLVCGGQCGLQRGGYRPNACRTLEPDIHCRSIRSSIAP